MALAGLGLLARRRCRAGRLTLADGTAVHVPSAGGTFELGEPRPG